jgi:hypothetical protein
MANLRWTLLDLFMVHVAYEMGVVLMTCILVRLAVLGTLFSSAELSRNISIMITILLKSLVV